MRTLVSNVSWSAGTKRTRETLETKGADVLQSLGSRKKLLICSNVLMIHIVGASCLCRGVGQLNKKQNTSLTSKITAISFLSLNPNINFHLKSLQFVLKNSSLRSKNNHVLWHKIIYNSLTKHKSDGYNVLHPKALVEILESYRSRICASLYCHKTGAPKTLALGGKIACPFFQLQTILPQRKSNGVFCFYWSTVKYIPMIIVGENLRLLSCNIVVVCKLRAQTLDAITGSYLSVKDAC